MVRNNPELHRSLMWLLAVTAVMSLLGFYFSPACGGLVLGSCLICGGIHLLTQLRRYRTLRSFSAQLEALGKGQRLSLENLF